MVKLAIVNFDAKNFQEGYIQIKLKILWIDHRRRGHSNREKVSLICQNCLHMYLQCNEWEDIKPMKCTRIVTLTMD